MTPDITRLRSLLERCERAEGPDRKLDVELWCLGKGGRLRDADAGMYLVEEPIDGFWIRSVKKLRDFPRYTASVDAAVALIEKMLPDWRVDGLTIWGGARVSLVEVKNDWHGCFMGNVQAEAKTPPLALLSALLKALIAREEQRAGEEKEVVG